MDEQQISDSNDKKTVIQDSVKKLKAKAEPAVNFTLLFSAIFNFCMLVVGSINVHNCPVNNNIPIFVIAIGAIGLTSKTVSYVRSRISNRIEILYFESALYIVETIFFFLGTYWVYSEFKPSYIPSDGKLYCNKTVYLFAFTYLTFYYGFLCALVCGFCCFICCAICLIAANTRTGDVESQSFSNPPTQPSATRTTEDIDKDTETKLNVPVSQNS